MELSAKLQMKPGQKVAVLAGASDVPRITADGLTPAETPQSADVVVAFVRIRADLDTIAASAIEAARRDTLVWIAYPKAGQLGTDLNRDSLTQALTDHGIRPVRQVAIDSVWSALRFRPV
ncbi:hypothetical protein ACWF95_42055 [Streptomyces vinaceus]